MPALPVSVSATAEPPVLQSLSLTLAGSLGALAGTTGLAALVYYLYGRRLRGDDDRKRALVRLQRAFRLDLPVVYLLALVPMGVAGWFGLPGDVAAALPGGTAVADAVSQTSREAVEAALEAFVELNDAPMDWGRVAAIRRMEPPLVRRIGRLRDRTTEE